MYINTQYSINQINIHKFNTQARQFHISPEEQTDIPVRLDNLSEFLLDLKSYHLIQYILDIGKNREPVYIDDDDRLIYNSNLMEIDKLYKLKWKGNIIALKKTKEGKIDFFEFEPDK